MLNVALAPKKDTGGYRHFPGTGPDGESCRSCGHSYTRKYGRDIYWLCHSTTKLRGSTGRPINLDASACKYWEPR